LSVRKDDRLPARRRKGGLRTGAAQAASQPAELHRGSIVAVIPPEADETQSSDQSRDGEDATLKR
jgi:hypothetical protein